MTDFSLRAMRAAAVAVLAAAGGTAFSAPPAHAVETLRVGKAVLQNFGFSLLDVGIKAGIFEKNGLHLDVTAFEGGPKVQQAMAAGSIDLALDTGPDMSFVAKGAPEKAIAVMGNAPLDICVIVAANSPIKNMEDLKGKKITASPASLTSWLLNETGRKEGWGPEGIEVVPTSSPGASFAALKTGQVDGSTIVLPIGLALEKRGEGKLVTCFGDLVKDFHTYVIFATNSVMASRPDAVRAFLKGWFETVAYARTHKADAITVAQQVMGADPSIMDQVYDKQMPMYSNTGRFEEKALATLRRSYVELKFLDKEPDMSKLYTEEFLPKN